MAKYGTHALASHPAMLYPQAYRVFAALASDEERAFIQDEYEEARENAGISDTSETTEGRKCPQLHGGEILVICRTGYKRDKRRALGKRGGGGRGIYLVNHCEAECPPAEAGPGKEIKVN